jgi:hypothetical protein
MYPYRMNFTPSIVPTFLTTWKRLIKIVTFDAVLSGMEISLNCPISDVNTGNTFLEC